MKGSTGFFEVGELRVRLRRRRVFDDPECRTTGPVSGPRPAPEPFRRSGSERMDDGHPADGPKEKAWTRTSGWN